MIYQGKSIQALQNDTDIRSWLFSFRTIQPTGQWQTFLKVFKKTFVCFHQFLFITTTTKNSYEFQPQYTSQNFLMAWHLILCSIDCIDLMCQTKELNKHAPGWVVIYISVHLVLIYTFHFSNVLLVLALNFRVHKSSYCKCSLAWCQVRTFLLFTICTHPLQMRVVVVLRSPIHANEPSEYNGMLYCTSNRELNNGIKVIILIA